MLRLPDLDAGISPAIATVAWLEQSAAHLFKLAPHLVLFALLGPDVSPATRATVNELARLLRFDGCSLIILDAGAAPAVPQGERAARRLVLASLAGRDGDPRATARALLSSPGHTLAVLRAGGLELESWVRATDPSWTVSTVSAPYRTSADLLGALASAVEQRTGVGIRTNPLIPSVFMLDLERARLAANIDRWVLAVDPRPLPQTEHLAALLRSLENAPLCPRIKLVVLDEPDGRLGSALELTKLEARVTPIDLGVEAFEGGAERALEQGVTPKERFRASIALSGFAAGRLETEKAVEHASAALALASGPEERAIAQLHLGQAWCRDGKLEEAARAFGTGIDELEHGELPSGLVSTLLWSLAGTALRAEERAQAAELFEQVAGRYGAAGQLPQQAAATVWRGEALRGLGDHSGASARWDEALALVLRIGPGLEDAVLAMRAEILERKSRLFQEQGDGTAARELHRHACACVAEPYVPPHP
jgi:tetratricopeptide (TPR) repeat protein